LAVAYVSLGSNIEPRLEYLKQAVKRLSQPPLVLEKLAGLYETEAVGLEGQPRFLNTLARVRTELNPEDLLLHLQSLEKEAGKKVPFRWGPRTLDLDLVLMGDETSDTALLQLPHPRMHERSFVLIPLCEVDPQARHPRLGRSVSELLAALPAPQPSVARIGGPELLR
jgi:2-amino-4-hydroxy-6-hydroxymethyldihydropteridine diphosphokinase